MIDLGIDKDSVYLIQANVIHTLLTNKCSLGEILNYFLQCRTVVFPSFQDNGFPNKTFDIRNTKSDMGVLSELARKHPNAVRSKHPMFSFVAIGKDAKEFDVDNYYGYGHDSPMGILHRMNAKIGILGLKNSHGNSFLHYIEQANDINCKYRFYKNFTGKYIDWDGRESLKTCGFHCNGGFKTLLDPLDDLLWAEGLYHGNRPYEGNGFRWIETTKLYDFVTNLIKDGKAEGILYERVGSSRNN